MRKWRCFNLHIHHLKCVLEEGVCHCTHLQGFAGVDQTQHRCVEWCVILIIWSMKWVKSFPLRDFSLRCWYSDQKSCTAPAQEKSPPRLCLHRKRQKKTSSAVSVKSHLMSGSCFWNARRLPVLSIMVLRGGILAESVFNYGSDWAGLWSQSGPAESWLRSRGGNWELCGLGLSRSSFCGENTQSLPQTLVSFKLQSQWHYITTSWKTVCVCVRGAGATSWDSLVCPYLNLILNWLNPPHRNSCATVQIFTSLSMLCHFLHPHRITHKLLCVQLLYSLSCDSCVCVILSL